MRLTPSTFAVFTLCFAVTSAFGQKPGDRRGKNDPERIIHMHDADGDGKLSKEEWAAHPAFKKAPPRGAARFTKLDKDKDGFLTLEELQAGTPKEGDGRRRAEGASDT